MNAVVTGGGRGLGRAFAVTLAQAGWRVAVVARTQAELDATASQLGPAGAAIQADVTDQAAVRHAFAEVEDRFGGLDLLINNAGMGPPIGPLWECDPSEWWRNIEVNLRGPALCCHAVLPGFIRRGGGRIINVASGAGTAGIPYFSAYVTAKTALIRLTEVLAAELAEHGVSVFAIEPGTVRTAMAEEALNSDEGRRWLPWFRKIFDDGLDVTTKPAEDLILRLARGELDGHSGQLLCAVTAGPLQIDCPGILRLKATAARPRGTTSNRG